MAYFIDISQAQQAQVASFKVFLHRLSEFLATSNLFLSDVSLWSQWYYTSVNLVCDQCLMTRLFSAVTYELFWNSLPNIFMRIFYFQPKCPKFCDMQLFEVKLFYSWALYKNIYWIWKKKKKICFCYRFLHILLTKKFTVRKSLKFKSACGYWKEYMKTASLATYAWVSLLTFLRNTEVMSNYSHYFLS